MIENESWMDLSIESKIPWKLIWGRIYYIMRLGLLDKNMGHPVKFEIRINDELFFLLYKHIHAIF